ncbi:hypothetical protein MBLNU230_g2664t1 [Neophaeotheca triangularis]
MPAALTLRPCSPQIGRLSPLIHTRAWHQQTLAIETSCDDTSVAVLRVSGNRSKDIRGQVLFHDKITAKSEAYNGIHPLIALESHQTNLAGLVQKALKQSASHASSIGEVFKPDFVTVTRGPGMRSNLAVGLDTAKGLALAWGVPLLGVHHMQAHALTPRLCHVISREPDSKPQRISSEQSDHWNPSSLKPEFPFLTVLASGGHTLLINSTGLTEHAILASTQDIAIGDCIDKAARAILPISDLQPPYGKALENFAFPNGSADYHYTPPARRQEELTRHPTPWGWSLGPPLADSKGGAKTSKRMAYSFAGLLTSIERFMRFRLTPTGTPSKEPRSPETITLEERQTMAREVQRVAYEHLASRILLHLATSTTPTQTVVVSGGVASSRYLRHVLRAMLDVRGFEKVELAFPPVELCTDNALMIAWAGVEMWNAGWKSGWEVAPVKKWSMDPAAEDGGILGVGGWVRREE